MLDRSKRLVSEMWSFSTSAFTNWDISRGLWFGPLWGSLRSLGSTYFFRKPIMEGTVVNYDLARSLYRNDNPDFMFGAGFVRAIIDLTVEYVGIPSVSNDDSGDTDAWLNDCITDHWAPQIQQIFRDATRDSKVIFRFRQPRIDNPLYTDEDREHGRIEVIPPESVDIQWNPVDPELIDMAVIQHDIQVDMRTPEEMAEGRPPRMATHQVQEIITPEQYQFFDKTAGTLLDKWTVRNVLGLVPLWPVYNEYAADLGGGQSDLEPVIPFIKAFHDVMVDVLSAHKYHSIPKVKFTLKDVNAFIRNNWPDILDDNGRPKPGAKLNWQGKEIMFFTEGEDGGFIEARSVLGDSKTLLAFLLDCIFAAAQVPKWAVIAGEVAISGTDSSTRPFEKKIERKRVMLSEPIAVMCKMALLARGMPPETQRVTWAPINLADLAAKGQAIQQLIMGFDVATTHRWMSDKSVVKVLAGLFPEMSAPEAEMQAAIDNLVVDTTGTAPVEPTNGNGNGNGKLTAKQVKALAATGTNSY